MPQKYYLQAFKFTFSFATHLPREVLDYVNKWVQKNSEYHINVTEYGKRNKLHMHCLVYIKKPKYHGDVKLVFWRALKKYAELDGSLQRHCIQINAAIDSWLPSSLSERGMCV